MPELVQFTDHDRRIETARTECLVCAIILTGLAKPRTRLSSGETTLPLTDADMTYAKTITDHIINHYLKPVL